MEYRKFKMAALDVAEKAGYLFEEDEQTGDIMLTADNETWIAVRSRDRTKIEKIVADEGEDYSNPAVWLLDQERALETADP